MKVICGWTHEAFPDSKYVCDIVKEKKDPFDPSFIGWLDCKDACINNGFKGFLYNFQTKYCQCKYPVSKLWRPSK